MSPKIRKNMKYYPGFKYCVGASDGTHIPAVIRIEKAVSYMSGRKNEPTDVMVLCSFDMLITWIWYGWGGGGGGFHLRTGGYLSFL